MSTESLSQYFNTPMVIIFIGAIITAIGGAWTAYQTNKVQTEIIQKTEKIALLNEKIASLVTGGETFPYIQPAITFKDKNHFIFTLLA